MSQPRIADYDVIYPQASRGPADSLPLGDGRVALNVWTESGGDVLFYIARGDAWSQHGRLLKLARVRLRVTPSPDVAAITQRLNLQQGRVEITLGPPGQAVSLWLWVDAADSVIHVEGQAPFPFALQAALEIWRTAPRELTGNELHSAYGLSGGGLPIIETPDTLVANDSPRVVWHHRNESSTFPRSLSLQGLESLLPGTPDPLLHRTFGGMLTGRDVRRAGPTAIASAQPQRRQHVWVITHVSQPPTAAEWQRQLEARAAAAEQADLKAVRTRHERTWRTFWDRSYLHVRGSPQAMTVSRGYHLQRYLLACAGRSAYPIKFNGSLFSLDWGLKDEPYDADYRRWGGPYWFQNTRLAYYPMLMAGDFDLMAPLFDWFASLLPLAEARTPLYFGHGGAFFPETQTFWGAYAEDNYGWDRTGKHCSQVDNTYIGKIWQVGLELLLLMLDYVEFSGDRDFVPRRLLPMAQAVLRFFAEHFPTGPDGRLRIEPGQACETWQDATDPLPEIAGLLHVLDRLLAWPEASIPPDLRGQWSALRAKIPDLPLRPGQDGQPILAPAGQTRGKKLNCENPELYAVFPYRLACLLGGDLELGRRTYRQRLETHNGGWAQDSIQAALLGLTDEARDKVAASFARTYDGSWFPAFWGPNFDWIPDQDHGCVAMIALQHMLLQSQGERLRLLPAWPADWDADFRLHAPGRTVLQGRVRGGRVVELQVTPKVRGKDVEQP